MVDIETLKDMLRRREDPPTCSVAGCHEPLDVDHPSYDTGLCWYCWHADAGVDLYKKGEW